MSAIIKAQEGGFGKSVMVLLGMDENPVSDTIYSIIEQGISKKYGIAVITNKIFYDARIQDTLKRMCLPFKDVLMTEQLKSSLPQEVFGTLPALVLYDGNQKQYVVEPISGNKKGYFYRKAIEAIEEYMESSHCANDFDVEQYTEGWSDYRISYEADWIRRRSHHVFYCRRSESYFSQTGADAVEKKEYDSRKEDKFNFVLPERTRIDLLKLIKENKNSEVAITEMIKFLQESLGQMQQQLHLVVCQNGSLKFRRDDGSLTDPARISTKDLAIYHLFLKHPEGVAFSDLENGDYKAEFKEIFSKFGDYRSSYYDTMVANGCSGLRSNIANIKSKLLAIGGVYAHSDFTITAKPKEKSVYHIKAVSDGKIVNLADDQCGNVQE